MFRIGIFAFLFLLSTSHFSWGAIEIAVTVDDLPSSGGRGTLADWKRISETMISVFKKHKVPGVYGFVNSKPLDQDPQLGQVLKRWVEAGNLLGNHTYHHADLEALEVSEYSKEILSNEKTLETFMGKKDYKYFRYPFLAEGETLEKRNAIRQLLFKNGYKLAPVTLDFFDYEWVEPYHRCLAKRDQGALKWLRQTYVEQALHGMEIAQITSQELFARDIKYVLLIHIGFIQSDVLDSLLTAFENKGAKFIELPTALADEVYQIDPQLARKRSYTFLSQILRSRKLPNPARVSELYDLLPEEKLHQICK